MLENTAPKKKYEQAARVYYLPTWLVSFITGASPSLGRDELAVSPRRR